MRRIIIHTTDAKGRNFVTRNAFNNSKNNLQSNLRNNSQRVIPSSVLREHNEIEKVNNNSKSVEENRNEKSPLNEKRTERYTITRYKNYSRKSGVYAYAFSPDKSTIYVYFNDHHLYKYDDVSSYKFRISEMIKRAKSGWGLNRYINKHKPSYYYKGRW